ncbi:MAG TPA: hypothetical protein PLI53_00285 [Geobacteraceae bacterium]|nr:hypothetical protein [Geobacteraceae bacterium]
MASRQDIRCYRVNLQDELNSAALYRALAASEKNEELAEVCRRLADTEQEHVVTFSIGKLIGVAITG